MGAAGGANAVGEAMVVEGDGEEERKSEEPMDWDNEYISMVTKGWIVKESGKCLVNVKFKSGDFIEAAELIAVIQDDYKKKVLRFIVKNKWGDENWMKQAEEGMKMSEGGQYNDWKGWVDFVEGEVREGEMDVEYLEMVRDGGGNQRQRQGRHGKN